MNIEEKAVVLQENGVPNIHNVYELETRDKQDNKTSWIPLDRFKYGTLEARENAHYSASSHGYDGFSEVVVGLELPYEGVTRYGWTYRVYEANGRIHVQYGKRKEL